MMISRNRLIFRRFLYAGLALSVLFTAGMGVLRLYVRGSPERYAQVAPYLFAADIAQMQVSSLFLSPEGKYTRAAAIRGYGMFSSELYAEEWLRLMEKSAQGGYAPAQTELANLLIVSSSPEAQIRAMQLYALAAEQNYEPAVIRLTLLERAEPLAPDASAP